MKALRSLVIAAAALVAACTPAKKEQAEPSANAPVTLRFATDWRAQAEHGGFYQALASGEYARRGLNVQIVQGGPGVNVPQLLAAGAVDLGMGSNSFIVMNLAREGVPVKAVAAFMQKDPQVLIAHPDASVTAFWVWLKARYGFTDDQVRKYTFNAAPFLADKRAAQQGYVTSEPYTIEKQAGFKPRVFLLADEGYPGYATMVLAPESLIARNPKAVQAFVEASAKGWRDYLTGDPSAADALIKKDNPEMTQDVLDQAREKLKSYRIVDGDEGAPPGAMSDARWQAFFDVAAAQGVYPKTLDWKRAYTLQFAPK
jgi:NitT/TauT family transport system substrate-binding protein